MSNKINCIRPQHEKKEQSKRVCYFVSRHLGAIEWARRHPWGVRAVHVTHLDPRDVQPGDTVIGTLPIHLAAEVCARGACYLHLALDLTAGQRGCELSPDELDAANARLVPYQIAEAQRFRNRQPD